jgi:hypothetical protein
MARKAHLAAGQARATCPFLERQGGSMEGGMIWVGIVLLLLAVAAGLVALAVSLRRRRQGG